MWLPDNQWRCYTNVLGGWLAVLKSGINAFSLIHFYFMWKNFLILTYIMHTYNCLFETRHAAMWCKSASIKKNCLLPSCSLCICLRLVVRLMQNWQCLFISQAGQSPLAETGQVFLGNCSCCLLDKLVVDFTRDVMFKGVLMSCYAFIELICHCLLPCKRTMNDSLVPQQIKATPKISSVNIENEI